MLESFLFTRCLKNRIFTELSKSDTANEDSFIKMNSNKINLTFKLTRLLFLLSNKTVIETYVI